MFVSDVFYGGRGLCVFNLIDDRCPFYHKPPIWWKERGSPEIVLCTFILFSWLKDFVSIIQVHEYSSS